MTHDELMQALTAERYTNPWWTTKPKPTPVAQDDDLTCARRRRELTADVEGVRRAV